MMHIPGITLSDLSRDLSKVLLPVVLLGIAACSGGGGGGNTAAGPQPNPLRDPVPNASPYLLDEIWELDFSATRSLIHPAMASSASNDVIRCTVRVREDDICTLSELSLLGMETSDPTIDDVMGRVVVTHDWMGTRFRALLERLPREVRLMTRGLTAIVISHEIRPSFYTHGTGAIYLDPERMWLTEAERSVITTREDPRIEDIEQLQFYMPFRYVHDQGCTASPPPCDLRELPRNLESMTFRMANLLYHELAHANDFFSHDRLNRLDTTVPIFRAAQLTGSSRLSGALPLTSNFMQDLAGVAFQSVTPTAAQLATTADDVAAEFPNDIANDFYNYSTPREDIAMAFEEAMMLYSFGIARDVAVTNLPQDPQSCAEFVVAWGQRNRIGDPAIGARSLIAVEELLPELADDIEVMLNDMPPPSQMRAGVDWCSNIAMDGSRPDARSLVVPRELPAEGHVQGLMPYM